MASESVASCKYDSHSALLVLQAEFVVVTEFEIAMLYRCKYAAFQKQSIIVEPEILYGELVVLVVPLRDAVAVVLESKLYEQPE